MSRRALLALAVLLVAACDRSGTTARPTPTESLAATAVARSADEAAADLCTRPAVAPASTTPAEGSVPPLIRDTMADVERVRGLSFLHPVIPQAATDEELNAGAREGLGAMYPEELFGRRSLAWAAIGVIPEGTRIDREVGRFGEARVLGYYDTLTKELVFLGTDDPSPGERVTLAHELVHALEDQHFDLSRIDRLLAACDDEAFAAALAVVEGSATFHMYAYADAVLTDDERSQWQSSGGSGPSGVDPFVEAQLFWPYPAGYWFVDRLEREVGERAVDGALADLPDSTEQILHADRARDRPIDVEVADLGPALGDAWRDLDVMEVGEAWLTGLFELRVDAVAAARAADGWGGARYRAWTDGSAVGVLLETVWDTPEDARQFASAMERWVGLGTQPAAVGVVDGTEVSVWFASDGVTLAALRAASA